MLGQGPSTGRRGQSFTRLGAAPAQRSSFGSALLPVSPPDGWRAVTAIGGFPVFSLCSYESAGTLTILPFSHPSACARSCVIQGWFWGSYKVGISQWIVKQETEQCQGEGESSLGVLSSHPGKDRQPVSPLGHKTRGVTLSPSAAGTMPLSDFWHHKAQRPGQAQALRAGKGCSSSEWWGILLQICSAHNPQCFTSICCWLSIRGGRSGAATTAKLLLGVSRDSHLSTCHCPCLASGRISSQEKGDGAEGLCRCHHTTRDHQTHTPAAAWLPANTTPAHPASQKGDFISHLLFSPHRSTSLLCTQKQGHALPAYPSGMLSFSLWWGSCWCRATAHLRASLQTAALLSKTAMSVSKHSRTHISQQAQAKQPAFPWPPLLGREGHGINFSSFQRKFFSVWKHSRNSDEKQFLRDQLRVWIDCMICAI